MIFRTPIDWVSLLFKSSGSCRGIRSVKQAIGLRLNSVMNFPYQDLQGVLKEKNNSFIKKPYVESEGRRKSNELPWQGLHELRSPGDSRRLIPP